MEYIPQIASIAIFLVMFALIITEKLERHITTLICAVLTMVLVFGVCMHSPQAMLKTLNLGAMFTKEFWFVHGEAAETSGINWATIIFIAGMMIMVEGMAAVGFFRWLCMKIAAMVRYKTIPVFITFMLMSAFLSMFIDSITVIMFLAAVTVELSQILSFNPVPVILSEIFCANLGGSATMCGDPPNIIIGTALGYSFKDFVTNTGLIAGVSLIAAVLYFYIIFRNELSAGGGAEITDMSRLKNNIENKKGFFVSVAIFLCTVIMLVTHAETGLTVSFIGVFAAVATLIGAGKNIKNIIKGVDYKTLLFFIGLFVVVGGLEQTGALELAAGFIGDISGGNYYAMVAIIIWVSAVASAFVDNIPFAATMLPVIKSLCVSQGIPLPVLVWSLSIGTDIGGSATPIGASANVVGTAVAARNGYPVGWGRYCLSAVPVTIITLLIATVCIFVRYL